MTFSPEWIKRKENVPELKNVSDYEERIRLLKRAHILHKNLIEDRKILLFDDLFQSGATLSAIAAALNEHGAQKVFALTVSRAGR